MTLSVGVGRNCWLRAGAVRDCASAVGVALQALQVGTNVGGVLVAQVTVFLERLVDRVFEFRRQVGIQRIGETGTRSRIAWKIRAEVSPRKGSWPVAISYNTTPKENKSVRESSSLPLACSGDM